MSNMDTSAFKTLRNIRYKNSSFVHFQLISYRVKSDISGKEFDINICEESGKHPVVRFSIYKIQYPASFIKSWLKIRNARCYSNRPLIFTFLQPIIHNDFDDELELVKVWKEAWSEAGWTPIILNIDDAMNHPEYDLLVSKLLVHVEGTQFYNGSDKYNFYCFIRWVSMAVVGGGWITDFDVLPLYSKPSFTLPNNGTLSIYNNHVPCIVSGSAIEWDRIAKSMFNNFDTNSHHGKKFWSDMLEIEKLMRIEGKPLRLFETKEISSVYGKNDEDENGLVSNPYNLYDKCDSFDGFRAIHFSHMSCGKVKFCHNQKRSIHTLKWYKSWLEQCILDISWSW